MKLNHNIYTVFRSTTKMFHLCRINREEIVKRNSGIPSMIRRLCCGIEKLLLPPNHVSLYRFRRDFTVSSCKWIFFWRKGFAPQYFPWIRNHDVLNQEVS